MDNANQKQKIAIMYDFDDTLSVDCMENFGLFQYLNVKKEDFFAKADERAAKLNMDKVLAFMFTLVKDAEKENKPLTKEVLKNCGKTIQFFPGVLSWFDRINKFGLDHGFVVEHYIISSGLNEIIEGSAINDKFKKIFACEYVYDENGNAIFPARAINYTNKTQFIFRINKGILDASDDSINDYMEKDLRPLVYENMIYIGDGFTDVPCMKLIKSKGGLAIAVYKDEKKETSLNLYRNGRVSCCCKADYSEGSDLDISIKNFILDAERKLEKLKI